MGKAKAVGSNDVNPDHQWILDKCRQLHQNKSHDYATDQNVFSNFEYAEQVARPFKGVHKVFATLMGIKMARLSVLLEGKIPKNESLIDSFADNTNYSAIWGSFFMKGAKRGKGKGRKVLARAKRVVTKNVRRRQRERTARAYLALSKGIERSIKRTRISRYTGGVR